MDSQEIYQQLPEGFENYRTVQDAAEEAGYSYAGYVGQLARDEKVPAIHIEVNGRKRTLVDVVALQAHKAQASAKGGFGGSRTTWRRFTLRVDTALDSPEHAQQLLEDGMAPNSYTMEKPKYYKPKKKAGNEDGSLTVRIVESLTPAVAAESADEDDEGDLFAEE